MNGARPSQIRSWLSKIANKHQATISWKSTTSKSKSLPNKFSRGSWQNASADKMRTKMKLCLSRSTLGRITVGCKITRVTIPACHMISIRQALRWQRGVVESNRKRVRIICVNHSNQVCGGTTLRFRSLIRWQIQSKHPTLSVLPSRPRSKIK